VGCRVRIWDGSQPGTSIHILVRTALYQLEGAGRWDLGSQRGAAGISCAEDLAIFVDVLRKLLLRPTRTPSTGVGVSRNDPVDRKKYEAVLTEWKERDSPFGMEP